MLGKSGSRKPTGETESSRRSFLKGILAGAGGLAAAVALLPRAGSAKAGRKSEAGQTPEPILYHRTEYVDQYFRTLS